MSKISYLSESTLRFFSDKHCPSCGSDNVKVVDSKFVVTRLFKCQNCLILFRHPKDSSEFNLKFYQKNYSQSDGITTDLPSKQDLEILKANNFKGKNADLYCSIFSELFNGKPTNEIKLVDYGCSWGYQSFQFLKKGFNCSSFDISKPRAEYGNANLGLSIKVEESQLPQANDIFFSSHVIEHVPSPSKMIEFGLQRLQSGGYFIAESPNGSDEFRKKDPTYFHRLWGRVHPNMLTADFYANIFSSVPYLITTSPFENIITELNAWDKKDQKILDLSGPELLVIAKKI